MFWLFSQELPKVIIFVFGGHIIIQITTFKRSMVSMNLIIGCLLLLPLFQDEWELRKEKDGIKVFTMESESSPIKSFKAEANFKTTPDRLLKVLKDLPNYPKWIDKCESGIVIEYINDDDYYIHTKIRMPFPVEDRDLVQHVVIDRNHSKGIYVEIESSPEYISEEESYIRMPYAAGYWLLIPIDEDSTSVEMVSTNDPGGSIPKWIVNAMIVGTPFRMMENLRTYLTTND